MRKVDGEFFELEAYSIYSAITKLFGDRGRDVVRLSGEIMFDELAKRYDLGETEPLALIRRIASHLKDVGYVESIEVQQVAPDEVEYVLDRPVMLDYAKRLVAEGAIVPHFANTLIAAGLKKACGIKAERVGDSKFLPGGGALVRLKLSRI